MRRQTLLAPVIQAVIVAALAGAWFSATQGARRHSLFLPEPARVWADLISLAASGALWAAAKVTLLTVVEAYAIAATTGILAGFLVARSERLVRLFEPMLSGLFAIPIVMIFPMFILFFGTGPASKVAYGAVYSFFPIALNTIAGFANVDRRYVQSLRSMGASGAQQLRHLYLPAALPVTLTGLRIGFFICIASVLGGETLAAVAGIGRSIALSAELMDTAQMYAWIVFVVLVTVTLNLLVYAAESRIKGE